MSTFEPTGRFLAQNRKIGTLGSGPKHRICARNRNLAGNRKNATPGNREEITFALQKLIRPELPEFQSSRLSAKSAFEPRNRVLLGKPENETPGPGEETGIAPRKPIPPNPLENRPRKPWSQGCRNRHWAGGLFGDTCELERMVERLVDLGWAKDAATDALDLLVLVRTQTVRAEAALGRLADLFHAVEWWDSGDWGEDQVRQTLAAYRGEAQ